MIGSLESRGVSVDYRPQVVLAAGTAGPDAYYAALGAAGAELRSGSTPGGALIRSLPISAEPDYVIRVNGGGGADTLTFNASAGVAAAQMFEFDGGAGIDTLRITGTAGLSITVIDGEVGFDPDYWLGFGRVESVVLDSTAVEDLAVWDGGMLKLAPGGRIFSAKSLQIREESTLDIADNMLVVAADDSNREEMLAEIQLAIFAARNGGPGIFSSSAAADQSVVAAVAPSGNIVILLALTGDVTLDDQINGDDYFALDKAFLAGAGASLVRPSADLNSDGVIDGADFLLLDVGFLGGVAAAAPMAARPAQPSPFSTASIIDDVLEEGLAPVLA